MPLTITGTLSGRDVSATRADDGNVTGAPDLLVQAAQRVNAGHMVGGVQPYPAVVPALHGDDLAFAMTIAACFDEPYRFTANREIAVPQDPEASGAAVVY